MRKAFFVAIPLSLAACEQQDPVEVQPQNVGTLKQELSFEEVGGVVSIEAENYTANSAQGSHSWTLTSASNASDGGVMTSSPDSGTNINAGYAVNSPRLDYEVTFAQSGTYQIWVRGRDTGSSFGSNDSLHVGLDGAEIGSSDRISTFTTSFGWSQETMDTPVATFEVPSAGVHTVNVWMREDGFAFDKLVIVQDTGFTPTGNGPAETPKDGPIASCEPSVYEAEDMENTTGGSVTDGWNIWSDGNISTTHAFPAGAATLTVTAQGTQALDEWPNMVVSVNGSSIGQISVTSTTWAEYSFPFIASAGSQEITVAFDNDYYDEAAGDDRNLIVDKVVITCPNSGCTDDDTQAGSTDCGQNGRGKLDQLCIAGEWEDTSSCVDPDQCIDDETQAGSTDCGLNDRGTLEEVCTLGQWQDSEICDDSDECLDDEIEVGTNSCGFNGNGGLELLCTLGVWVETSICSDPDECLDDASEAGTTACGLNARGLLDRLCESGTWTDTDTCVDSDECTDASTQAGSNTCGQNGRGFEQELCTAGAWVETGTCLDPDQCIDDATQEGAACGFNGRGAQDQLCVAGAWSNTGTCVDPDLCVDDSTQEGQTTCGLNNRGLLDELCVSGQWQDSAASCIDPDECTDDANQTGQTACGLNARGDLQQVCVAGGWVDDPDTCIDSDECVDDATQGGTASCGFNGRGALDQLCVAGNWTDSITCVDADVCTDDSTQSGTTPCGSNGALQQLCSGGQWMDGITCVESGYCGDDICAAAEDCSSCATDCDACQYPTSTYLEAEFGVLSGSSTFSIVSDASASAGAYIEASSNNTASPGPNRADYEFNVEAGTYTVWMRADGGSFSDDSIWFSMDGGDFVRWNDFPQGGWTWDDAHDSDSNGNTVTFALTTGTHTFTIANREDGFLLDKFYITSEGDTPSGEGGSDSVCGDALCSSSESCDSCTSDCGSCIVCVDGSTQSGTSSCGDNARGTLTQLCVGGDWSDTSDCVDLDLCVDDATQPGSTSCGFNARGSLDELCVIGQWQDSINCVDPDECQNDLVQGGTSFCGLNNRGALQQLCVDGTWSDTSSCVDPDVCVDDSNQTGSGTCGLNNRGILDELCVGGSWTADGCSDPDQCVDGLTQAGTTPCGNDGALQLLCSAGQWGDSSVCIEGGLCGDTICSATEDCGSCAIDCGVCSAPSAVYFEAELGNLSGSPSFSIVSDSGAAGGQYLEPTSDNLNAAGPNRVEFEFNVDAGSYVVWVRGSAASAMDDSIWISMDGAAFVRWNDFPNGNWVWDDAHDSDGGGNALNFNLSEGLHTLTIANREDGFLIDKIYITSDGDTPSGEGNATDFCGDALCGATEDCSVCESDCGSCVDTDGDGVVDQEDLCPNTSSGATVDVRGCEESDWDGDGVLDFDDQCPNTTLGDPVDLNGCSIADADGDGVVDSLDACPGTSAGTPVNQVGCPFDDTIPEWTGPAPADSDFETETLVSGVNEPMEVEMSTEGEVYIIGRRGEFYSLENGSLIETSEFDVQSVEESGLIGFALDPLFVLNRWAYFHYTHPEEDKNVVSRITINPDNSLDFSSESVFFTYDVQLETCCHAAGEMEFGPNGNLYISTGDNTDASNYAPIDERPGWSTDDAQKSASNTNDLRGKILRITPTAEGGYTSPVDNLFADDATHRSEIFVMGNRNPFRIAVDQQTGELFWGEVGPDANASSASRGPTGYDELNRTTTGGNFGWPYFSGDNEPYNDYNFATNQSGAQFDPQNVVNDSPNNTGATTDIPDAQPSWVKLSHRATMVGGVYRWDGSMTDPFVLPSYFHGRLLYWNFNNDEMFEAPVDTASPPLRRWLNTAPLNGIIDAVISPENGRLYLLGYGGNCCNNPANAGMLVEVRYVGDGGVQAPAEGYAINAGGESYIGSDGTTYSADTLFSGGDESVDTMSIAGTSDETLYQSHRWQEGGFSYSLPLVNDEYVVTLKFAEIFVTEVGERNFHVDAEGQPVITDLDIFAAAGAETAYDRSFNVTVTDGALNLDFISDVENPMVSAIVVKKTSGLEIGVNISLQAGINGKYVTANSSDATASANGVSDGETFTIVDGGAGTVALQSLATGQYLSVANDGAFGLSASADSVTLSERFQLFENLAGYYVLRSQMNSLYVTASEAGAGVLTASSSTIGGWQIFDVSLVSVCDPIVGYGIDCRPQAAPYLNMPISPTSGLSNVPALLSQTGAFADVASLEPSNSLIPFEPIAPLWSDRALKTRWVSIPSGERIGWTETGKWDYPAGTVFVKQFDLQVDDDDPLAVKRLETRLLMVQPGGTVYGVTYKWRDDESDADLLTTILEEPITIASSTGDWTQTWVYPGPSDCLSCHTTEVKGVLGAKTASLNDVWTYPSGETDNQLRTWNYLGLFDQTLDESQLDTYPAHANINDVSKSTEHRVRSYWDMNCASCHGPLGIAALWDARFDTPLSEQGVVDGPLANQRNYLEEYGLTDPRVVDPGNPGNSILYIRDASEDAGDAMPPIARSLRDDAYIDVLEEWINGL